MLHVETDRRTRRPRSGRGERVMALSRPATTLRPSTSWQSRDQRRDLDHDQGVAGTALPILAKLRAPAPRHVTPRLRARDRTDAFMLDRQGAGGRPARGGPR